MSFLNYFILTLVAALGGSAFGAIFVALVEGDLPFVLVIFAVSLPFTIVGAALLSGAGYLLREGLSKDWSTYFPIFAIALIAGPLMTFVLMIEIESAFVGGVFALLTAAVWTIWYRTRLATDFRSTDNV